MQVSSSLLFLSLASCVFGLPRQQQSRFRLSDNDECPKVMIFGVRGTLEEPGFGAMEPLVQELVKTRGTEAMAIDYPAGGIILGDEPGDFKIIPYIYAASKTQGGDELRRHLYGFNEECPKASIVLMGYSQGAHVVGDTVCGVTPGIWPVRPQLDEEIKQQIAAVIMFGDPANLPGLPYHKGTSTRSGVVPRIGLGFCAPVDHLFKKYQSYCDADDIFCDQGKSVEVHKQYVQKYGREVLQFVKDKISSSSSSSDSSSHSHLSIEIDL